MPICWLVRLCWVGARERRRHMDATLTQNKATELHYKEQSYSFQSLWDMVKNDNNQPYAPRHAGNSTNDVKAVTW